MTTATRLGVLRTYATRHGPGPFVTEDAQALGAPVVLGSYGPTAADKRQLNVRAASGAAA